MNEEVEATNDLTSEFIKTLHLGIVLGFNKNGHLLHWEVVRLNRKSGRVWLKRKALYTPEQFAELEAIRTGERMPKELQ